MRIQKVSISQINPAPYNPRVDLKPGDPDYEKLKNSLTVFGYVEPLVWNERTKTLISGHQRLKILISQGMEDVDVSVVDLSVEKEKALNLALNKIRGDWDEDKLGELLEELQKTPDFDIDLTGFDLPEITELLDNLHEADEEDGFDFEGALEAIEEPVTKKGDLIELGPHRILCGDSSNREDLKKLIKEEVVSLLHTDPPYNVNYYGGKRPHVKARPKSSRQWERIYCDNMDQGQYEAWLKTILENASLYFAQGAAVYIWNGHRQFGPMYQMLTKLGFHVSCVITWVKECFSISYADYNQQSEFCLYGWKQKTGSHRWFGPANESTVWQIKRDATKGYIHPTQKPIALAQRAMRNSSLRDEVVLDLFLGSGSTLIAAESLNRRCFGVEIDPRYCDAIIRRYIALKGQENVSSEVRAKYLKEAPHA